MAAYSNYHPAFPTTPFNTINPVMPLNGIATPSNLPTSQFLLPQPIGSAYVLNTSSEIANIPAGTAMSVGLCLNENTLYIKTLQNNNPVLVAYRLSPMEQLIESPLANQQATPQVKPDATNEVFTQQNEDKNIVEALNKVSERLEKIETTLFTTSETEEKRGKTANWQI